MITVILMRHAECDIIGKGIAGRLPGVHLNAAGRARAESVAASLCRRRIDGIYASPLERAIETAIPLSARITRDIAVRRELMEIDYGEWTGKSFDELERLPRWREFNGAKSRIRIPGGELLIEVQARMATAIEAIRGEVRDGGTAVVVSHSDPIKTAVAYYTGIDLDSLGRLRIDPASMSELLLDDWGAALRVLNGSDDPPRSLRQLVV